MTLHGIGLDIASIPRIAAIIERYGEGFATRWFDPVELSPSCAENLPERVASRFASKEAVWKALGLNSAAPVPWKQIVITPHGSGCGLSVRLAGDLARTADSLGVGTISATVLTHGDVAVAVALAERRSPQR